MRSVRIDLPQTLDVVELHTFADWHIGDKACDLNAIKKEIEEVRDNPNAYVICNGDLVNNATKTSVSDCYAEVIPPQAQIDLLVELLEPIKDKILAMTQGNHEARTYRNDGIDLTQIVASRLGLLDNYMREGGVIFLRFGKSSSKFHHRPVLYSLYCTHGSGGGRKEGAKAIRLAEMSGICDADCFLHSHTHLPLIMKQNYYRIDTTNSTVAEVEKLFVNTAAQLHYGGYGQTGEFKPSNRTSPIILLDGHKKNMKAVM